MIRKDAAAKPEKTKRLLAIHDLAGFSHTSLMAVIPVMSRQGIAVTALPTAVLSSNTEHSGFQLADLTPHLQGFINHWQQLKLDFDAIYSGFLCNGMQVETVINAIQTFRRKGTLVVVDPVMADNGQLYPCFDQSIINSMQRLVSQADLITPNLTEAAFLLQEPYQESISQAQAKVWCSRLAELGPGQVLITNVPIGKDRKRTSAIAFDKRSNTFSRSTCVNLQANYPGTGDIFTSVLVSLLLKGMQLFPATRKTVRFICRAMQLTMQTETNPLEGIALERALRLIN